MRYYEQDKPRIDRFREEYEFLSNFYPAKLEYEGLLIIIQRQHTKLKSVRM